MICLVFVKLSVQSGNFTYSIWLSYLCVLNFCSHLDSWHIEAACHRRDRQAAEGAARDPWQDRLPGAPRHHGQAQFSHQESIHRVVNITNFSYWHTQRQYQICPDLFCWYVKGNTICHTRFKNILLSESWTVLHVIISILEI